MPPERAALSRHKPPTADPLDALMRRAADSAPQRVRAWLTGLLVRGERAEGTTGKQREVIGIQE